MSVVMTSTVSFQLDAADIRIRVDHLPGLDTEGIIRRAENLLQAIYGIDLDRYDEPWIKRVL